MGLFTVNSVSLQSLFVAENLWLSGLCDYLKTLSKPKVGATEFKITMLYIHYAILWFQICICWVSISVNWQKLRCSQTFDFVVLLLQLSFLVIYLYILSILLPRIPQGIIYSLFKQTMVKRSTFSLLSTHFQIFF